MYKWEAIVERKIREAMEEGAFQNLEGAGKPLPLEEDPFENPTMRQAHRLLRHNGFSLPWIEERKELQAAVEKLRGDFTRCAGKYCRATADHPSALRDEDAQVLGEFRRQVRELNRRIAVFNLKSPSTRFHLALLDAEGEIGKLMGRGTSTPMVLRDSPPGPARRQPGMDARKRF
jgi:DnaJ homolog subfamily C member 28